MKGSSKHNHVHVYTTKPTATSSTTTTPPPKTKEEDDMVVSDPGSLEAASNVNVEEAEPQSFLLGPMVVRVLPNGMPIPGKCYHQEALAEFECHRRKGRRVRCT